MNIKLSVIIPFFNTGVLVKGMIDSLKRQDDVDGCEFVFIDDGSTDNTQLIIQNELKNSSFNYRIINQKNTGVSAARNTGIINSQGQYILFLDSDDYLYPNSLKMITNELKESKDLILYRCNFIDKKYKELRKPNIKNINKENLLHEYLQGNLLYQIHLCSLIINKSTLLQNSLKFTVGRSYGEDQEFVAKLFYLSKNVEIKNEVIFGYVQHQESAMSRVNLKRFDSVKAFEDLKSLFNDAELKKTLDSRISQEIMDITKLFYKQLPFRKSLSFYKENVRGKFFIGKNLGFEGLKKHKIFLFYKCPYLYLFSYKVYQNIKKLGIC